MKKLLVILFFISVLVVGCTPTNIESTTTSIYTFEGGTTTPTPRSLRMTFATGKAAYFPGDNIALNITFFNNIEDALTLNGFPPKTVILHNGSPVRTFWSGAETVKLGAGEYKKYTINWDSRDDMGNPVSPAVYQIYTLFPSITKGFSSNPYGEGYMDSSNLVINFPQGAMEKTITVNQSQTVGDVTITVNRVEFSGAAMKVYTEKTPLPLREDPNEPPFWRGKADSTVNYKFDDGFTFETTGAAINVLENSVEYIWEDLYPAPSDARKLFFTITKMSIPGEGDFGPFSFEIPL